MEKEKESTTDIDGHLVEEKGKGKGRDLRASVAEDFSSSASMIGEETPIKPPIHVQVHGLRRMDSGTFGPPPAVSTPARESATPTPGTLPATPLENRGDVTSSFPDPPTPELAAFRDPDISVSNDLASLLDSLNLMFLEHPERNSMARVAEDIQRVARDAQTAVAVGAQEMHRTMQEARQQAQQEAARRVTEAVGNILRVFGAGGAEPASGTHISSSSVRVPLMHRTPILPARSPIAHLSGVYPHSRRHLLEWHTPTHLVQLPSFSQKYPSRSA
ncbi:hypothetical protein B0F90DRAFT_123596 [Multifurca ochricompacta]|uniref:Uncharacterized protein n=1 Tax=Multifurca ochricompacta TaxID=376703 RepID=A0AAD4QUB4_9AGAM|nr:hypothetical protein B0F90DRAFT_123596 [Multifurca ochricompacta]